MADPMALAKALSPYGPKTQQAARRSQYLSDALRAMGEGNNKITGGLGEVATKLLAQAILQRASNKAENATLSALSADRSTETDSLLGALRGPKSQAPPVAAAMPSPEPLPQLPPQQALQAPAPQPQAPPPQAQPQPQQQAAGASPQDLDALTRMLATEAIGEGPQGMAAAGHVALNRLKSGFMGAKSIRDVVTAPHQFSGMARANQVSPQDYEQAQQVAQGILSGQLPDPTGGAINFLNPELQQANGQAIPSWARGEGQRIGRHVFYGGQPGAQGQPPQQQAQAAPQQAPEVQMTSGPPPQQSFQVASAGPLQPGMIPSAPVSSSPPGAGSPPVAPAGPQANGAAGAGSWPTYQPSEAEIGYVEGLLRDPRTFDQGRAEAMKLQQKMTQPVAAKIVEINKVPFYVPETPTPGQPPVMIPVPREAMTHTLDQAPPGMPQGAVVQETPLGDRSILYQPPAGYQGAPNRQSFIQGSAADPAAGLNLVAGEGKLRDDYAKEVQPYIAAREGYQKVIAAAKDHTQAGAIALVFGYMKTLDPGSTVREGEQAQVSNSGTIPQTVQNLYNKLLAGTGSLDDAQRAQFANSARTQFGVYQKTFDAANERYGGLASSYGYDPSRIVRKFGEIEPYVPPQASQNYPAAVNQAHETMVQRGQYDARAKLGSAGRPFLARTPADVQAMDRPENKGAHIILPDGSLAVID